MIVNYELIFSPALELISHSIKQSLDMLAKIRKMQFAVLRLIVIMPPLLLLLG